MKPIFNLQTYFMFLKLCLTSFFTFTFFISLAQPSLFNQSYDETTDFDLSDKQLITFRKQGELVVFNEDRHETKVAKEIFKKRVGKSFKKNDGVGITIYTVIAVKKTPHYRLNYIFLDGNQMNEVKLQNMLKSLRKMLDDDIKFESVARQYSMDYNGKRGGDSGWFKEKKSIPQFFEATNRPKLLANEIFEVELAEMNWHYIIKKTYTPINIREVLVLVEKENN